MMKRESLTEAAAKLVLRELTDIEARDVFGGGGWVKVGPAEPLPPGENAEL